MEAFLAHVAFSQLYDVFQLGLFSFEFFPVQLICSVLFDHFLLEIFLFFVFLPIGLFLPLGLLLLLAVQFFSKAIDLLIESLLLLLKVFDFLPGA